MILNKCLILKIFFCSSGNDATYHADLFLSLECFSFASLTVSDVYILVIISVFSYLSSSYLSFSYHYILDRCGQPALSSSSILGRCVHPVVSFSYLLYIYGGIIFQTDVDILYCLLLLIF